MTLVERLRHALGPGVVFSGPENVIVYEYDYGLDRAMPDLVALPRSALAYPARWGASAVRGALAKKSRVQEVRNPNDDPDPITEKTLHPE